MLRTTLTVMLLVMPMSTVMADISADRAASKSRKLSRTERIAACNRLLDDAELDDAERVEVLLRRGDLLEDEEQLEAAASDYQAALNLDPQSAEAYFGRGYVRYHQDRYAEAERDLSAAIEITPQDRRFYYFRGRTRHQQGRFDDAVADFNKALKVSPRYRRGYYGQALAFAKQGKLPEAVEACKLALENDPYDLDFYLIRGRAHRDLQHRDEAIRDLSIASALDPNQQSAKRSLQRLGATTRTIISNETNPFLPPRDNMTVTYLQTRREAPKVRPEDEIIGGLVGWFKERRMPTPTHKRFLDRRIITTQGSVSYAEITYTHPHKDGPLKKLANYRRSLWPLTHHGPMASNLEINLDPEPIDSLWPLEVGNQASGKGPIQMAAPGGSSDARFTLGAMTWSGRVVGREQVTTAAGTFETVKIEWDETREITMLGRTQKLACKTTMWYAPSLRWWVKRTREHDGEILTDEAVAIS